MTHSLNDPNLMRQIILDHYQYRRNKKAITNSSYSKLHVGSDGCIDQIDLYALIQDGKILDIAFDGVACAISTASTSIMTELLKGKSLEDATAIIHQYLQMIHEQPYDGSMLEEAVVFQNTYKQANRIKCATIGWTGMQKIINESK